MFTAWYMFICFITVRGSRWQNYTSLTSAKCQAGSYSDGLAVTMCPRGQYQDEKGHSSCKQVFFTGIPMYTHMLLLYIYIICYSGVEITNFICVVIVHVHLNF